MVVATPFSVSLFVYEMQTSETVLSLYAETELFSSFWQMQGDYLGCPLPFKITTVMFQRKDAVLKRH